MRQLASIVVFPVVMATALYTVWRLIENGVRPESAVFYVLVPGAFLVGALERFLPYRDDWNESKNDIRTDFIHMLVGQIAIPSIVKPLWAAALTGVVAALAARFGGDLWPHHWPLLVQVFLMLLIAEFGRYWFHRAAHEIPLLWRFHEVHHSPKRLYWLNAGRFHPIEKIYLLLPEAIPFILLGTNVETLSLYFVFNGIHGLFQHSNVKITLGPLNYLFAMTELHRWHHSLKISESNNNYGNNLIVWDLVFGTYFLPRDREVGEIGIHEAAYPDGYIGQLGAPFRPRGQAE